MTDNALASRTPVTLLGTGAMCTALARAWLAARTSGDRLEPHRS
ncbi:hypothetical protein ACFYO2_04585 [Streptomyces sp. NPDC006602]